MSVENHPNSVTEIEVQTEVIKGYNYLQIFITGIMLLGPFIMGMAINSIGNEGPIRSHFALFHGYTNDTNKPELFPAELWSLGFLYPFGGLFGALIGAYTVDKIGRRYSNFLFCSSAILGAIFKIISRYSHVALLFMGRFFDGIAAAGFMISSILLLLECLPEKLRKIYNPLINVGINSGILSMGIISLNSVAGDNWNLIHLFIIVLSIILALTTFLHPESPTFIYSNRRDSTATRNVFKKLRGKYYDENEFLKLKKLVQELSQTKKMSVLEYFREKRFTFPTVSLICLHMSQQLCGINYIIGFAPTLLTQAGFPSPDVGGTIIFTATVISAIIASPIVSTQKRKLLLIQSYLLQLISFAAYMITDYANGPSSLKIFWFCLYAFFFNQGSGSITWFIAFEMLPPQASGTAQGIAGSFNWLANVLVYLIVPVASEKLGSQLIFLFIAIHMVILPFLTFLFVETKNKTPYEVLADYQKLLHPKLMMKNDTYNP